MVRFALPFCYLLRDQLCWRTTERPVSTAVLHLKRGHRTAGCGSNGISRGGTAGWTCSRRSTERGSQMECSAPAGHVIEYAPSRRDGAKPLPLIMLDRRQINAAFERYFWIVEGRGWVLRRARYWLSGGYADASEHESGQYAGGRQRTNDDLPHDIPLILERCFPVTRHRKPHSANIHQTSAGYRRSEVPGGGSRTRQ
jgi:hypothetical protein